MSNPRLRIAQPRAVPTTDHVLPLGRHLVNAGHLTERDLVNALVRQRSHDAPLGSILMADDLVSEDQLMSALAQQHQADLVDLDKARPPPQIAEMMPHDLCLQFSAVPWRWLGSSLMVATSRPDRFKQLRRAMGQQGAQLIPVVAKPESLRRAICSLYGQSLATIAAEQVPASRSCRGLRLQGRMQIAVFSGLAALLFALATLHPAPTFLAFFFLATLCVLLTSVLKLVALSSHIVATIAGQRAESDSELSPDRWPKVSVLVPLFREENIAEVLVKRLERLTYPKALLEVVLVLEAKDKVTRDTLARTELPHWMTVIEVPDNGSLTTKPRALNYALSFCQGSIIGVWDAEDAPAPDQIEAIAARFAKAPGHVACLQGRLDYYNSRANAMARWFTIEYATWWRVMLPGIARAGFAVPLGGTTLFFRRSILEDLGGWDAHNVTEDADLGIRLARHGYVTELVPTVTMEEANCRPLAWVRQRSRWLKGFLITWIVHMRAPVRLLRDLGWLKFWGFQVLFLASFVQFLFAPFLWTFWLVAFGVGHPVSETLSSTAIGLLITLFVGSEFLNLAMSVTATSGPKHRHLIAWVPFMPVYFILGTLAAFKAFYELIFSPFYWDKTQHGVSKGSDPQSSS